MVWFGCIILCVHSLVIYSITFQPISNLRYNNNNSVISRKKYLLLDDFEMESTFKVPSIPLEKSKTEDEAKSSTPNNVESSHTSFIKPELPPTNFSMPMRHKNLQYDIPDSSANPPFEYALEVLRNGVIIDYIALSSRPYTVFGRSPDSDVVLEHPTISRYHAIVQYKSEFESGNILYNY